MVFDCKKVFYLKRYNKNLKTKMSKRNVVHEVTKSALLFSRYFLFKLSYSLRLQLVRVSYIIDRDIFVKRTVNG